MQIKSLYLLISLLLLLQSCCDNFCDDYPPIQPSEGVIGKWNWIKSVGGSFGGGVLTPESEGYSKHIILNDFYYSEFQNDIKLFEKQYDIELRLDTFLGSNAYLILDSGFEFTFIQSNDTLVLTEVCFDCYRSTYVRDK